MAKYILIFDDITIKPFLLNYFLDQVLVFDKVFFVFFYAY